MTRASIASLVLVVATVFTSAACNSERGGQWVEASQAYRDERPVAGANIVDERDGLQPYNRTNAGCSRTAAVFFMHGPLAVMFVLAAVWAEVHRRRARVQKSFDPKAPLAAGPAVIFGVVEDDLSATEGTPPVRIIIQQTGREWQNKGQWSHSWTESSRDVRVRPFYVRRDDGSRVRVEPDTSIALHDDLSRTQRLHHTARTRTAELTVGERVHILGTLFGVGRSVGGGAYRAMESDPVLRPPRGGRMVISTEPPGDTETKRMRFHFGWAAGILVVLCAVIAFTRRFEMLTLDGRTVIGSPTHTRTWEVYVKPKNQPGHWVPHYAVRVQVPWGNGHISVDDECSLMAYRCADAGECDVPFIVSEHAPGYAQIGRAPVLTDGEVALGVIAAFVTGLVFAISTFTSRPWYQKKKVTETAGGRL